MLFQQEMRGMILLFTKPRPGGHRELKREEPACSCPGKNACGKPTQAEATPSPRAVMKTRMCWADEILGG